MSDGGSRSLKEWADRAAGFIADVAKPMHSADPARMTEYAKRLTADYIAVVLRDISSDPDLRVGADELRGLDQVAHIMKRHWHQGPMVGTYRAGDAPEDDCNLCRALVRAGIVTVEQIGSGTRAAILSEKSDGSSDPVDGDEHGTWAEHGTGLVDERDISSDPDEALTYIDDEYLRRDISSDPVDAVRAALVAREQDLRWCNKNDDCATKAEGVALAISDLDAVKAKPRDISSVTGSGWDGWPERGAASREFRQRVEAMTRQVYIEKPKWSGSMCMTEAERRVLAAIRREAVEPWRKAYRNLAALYHVRFHNIHIYNFDIDPKCPDVQCRQSRALLEGKTDE